MVIAAIILGLLALAFGVIGVIRYLASDYGDEGFGWLIAFAIFGLAWVFVFFGALNWSWSSDTLTGYVYSSTTTRGYTTAHIRFSEQAGTDVQPEFCVKADSIPGRQIKELTGSGKKVQITIPSYFYFSNNPFACGTAAMTIEETK